MVATSEKDERAVGLRAHATSPKRTVFTEPDNSDGWISTDMTVEIRR
jgi:hypothetical protein